VADLTSVRLPEGFVYLACVLDAHSYCSFAYVQRLQSVGAQISMSAPGQATENARAESFFKTVKYEEVYVHRYQTFLEDVYNAKRLHSSLDYVPPDEFEENYLTC
jgi:putative transposase